MDRPKEPPASGTRAAQLIAALSDYKRIVLASHINPDPDAIASMVGLRALLSSTPAPPRVSLTLDGIIARAENQAMVRYLGIELTPIEAVDFTPETALVLVDTQPRTGRVYCEWIVPVAVLDHHETPGCLEGVRYLDLRPNIGATTTMVVGYLLEAGVAVDSRLATALFYGIDSETSGYPRESSGADDAALAWLYPRVDQELLARIKNPRLPQSYFATYKHALSNAFLYDDVVVSYCGDVPQPDIVAELADFFVRFDQVSWALCAGVFEDQLRISVRADHIGGHGGEVLRAVVNGLGVAGGHDRRAGGAIELNDTSPEAIDLLMRTLRLRFLERIGADEHQGRRLLDASPVHPVP